MSSLTIFKNVSIAMVGATLMTLGTTSAARSLTLLSTSSGELGTINPKTAEFTKIGNNTNFSFWDIALHEDGRLFGVSSTASLYEIDPTSGVPSLIAGVTMDGRQVRLNALGFSTTNQLYGAGGSTIYSLDPTTGVATLKASIFNFASTGDVVWNPKDNIFLATSRDVGTDSLYSIDLNGNATKIGDIGFNGVMGLFFDEGTLYGYTVDRKQITIDLATGAGQFDKALSGTTSDIFGAASLPSTGPKIDPPTDPSTSVPEPSTVFSLLGFGMLGLGLRQRAKQSENC